MTDAFVDATAQAELIRRGDASPLELVEEAINRAEKVNGGLNAIIHPLYDKAREQAAGALPEGPFRGVPIVLKDLNCQVEGDPYNAGMNAAKRAGWRSDHTDALAQKFLDAGFVCIGRTNTPELGIVPTAEPLAWGPTRNPWNTTRTTGGSSGGSAAAVASGIVAVGHANDGGGSIRIPASCCGLVGLKPSRGRTSTLPDSTPLDSLLNVELCVTRTVRDTAGVLDAVHGAVTGDSVSAPPPARPFVQEVGTDPGKLRVGLLAHNPLGTGEIHADCVAAAERAAQLLESLGHTVVHEFPNLTDDPALVGHFTNLWAAQNAADIDGWSKLLGRSLTADDVEPLTWALAEMGRATSAPDYIAAQRALLSLQRGMEEWFASGFDLLLTPTLGEPPVPLGQFHTPEEPLLGFMRAATFVPFTPLTNMTGEPAISLPLHWNAQGLPIGVHLVAAYGREDLMLRVASQLEQAQPWVDRVPPVHA
jgi:amidase